MLLISDIVFKTTATVVFTVASGLTFAVLWGVLPLYRRAQLSAEER